MACLATQWTEKTYTVGTDSVGIDDATAICPAFGMDEKNIIARLNGDTLYSHELIPATITTADTSEKIVPTFPQIKEHWSRSSFIINIIC